MATRVGHTHIGHPHAELHCRHRGQIETCTRLNRNWHSTVRTISRCRSLVPVIGIILAFPGWFATLYTFGVHSSGGYEIAAYTLIINAFIYSGAAFLLLWKRTAP